MGESRIDRIYTTKEMSDKKIGVENVKAAFTDHLSVVMRLSVDVPIVRRGKGFWETNTSFLIKEAFKKEVAPEVLGLEAAEKVLHRMVLVVGKV